MKWRDASERPKVLGEYFCLCRNSVIPDCMFRTTSWWNGEVWGKDVMAWLDPEIPEKYLPNHLREPVKEENQVPEGAKRSVCNVSYTWEEKEKKPRGEWLPPERIAAMFSFRLQKFFVRHIEDDETSVMCLWVILNSDCPEQWRVWSIPVEEPPR